MIKLNRTWIIFLGYFLMFPQPDLSMNKIGRDILKTPISQQGTVSFLLHTDKTYSNGEGQENFAQPLVNLPGLASFVLLRNDTSVNIYFLWEKQDRLARSFHIELTDLPGLKTYFFLFTWDAAQGLCDGYMNGIPLRYPGTHFEPWKIDGQAKEYVIPSGKNNVTDVTVSPQYMTPEKAKNQVPKQLFGGNAHLIGLHNTFPSLDITKRKGKLLYSTNMDSRSSIEGWVMEGPGILKFEKGHMTMASEIPNPDTRQTGHFTFWCPVEFPESFIAEWEFKPIKEHGLSIIFFAARGENGEDIFDPALPKRDGHYPQYTSKAILNYHIIYFSHLPVYQTGNVSSRMRKANKFYNVALGRIGVQPGKKDFHGMRLIKDKSHIQLLVNDKICMDFTDPGNERWGKALAGGKIGFRQMAVTFGAYRNFCVWQLTK